MGPSLQKHHEFPLLMLSAMFENGGNLVQRFFDGHPQMFVYPFESQLGTELVMDHLTTMFPAKYRWPVFPRTSDPVQDYQYIIDQECKGRATNPKASKFRHYDFEFVEEERLKCFSDYMALFGRSRGNTVAAFFQATFNAWRNYRHTGEEKCYVGFSPIIAVDADKILKDLPAAHVLHIVRNPYSGYADTKKRAVPPTLDQYMAGWKLSQHYAMLFKKRFPNRMHIVRLEDVLADPKAALGAVCEKLGLRVSSTLKTPTWNGSELDQIYPWGIISVVDPAANLATAEELSPEEREAVCLRGDPYLAVFGYCGFFNR